jgi:hypothetical protein
MSAPFQVKDAFSSRIISSRGLGVVRGLLLSLLLINLLIILA